MRFLQWAARAYFNVAAAEEGAGELIDALWLAKRTRRKRFLKTA